MRKLHLAGLAIVVLVAGVSWPRLGRTDAPAGPEGTAVAFVTFACGAQLVPTAVNGGNCGDNSGSHPGDDYQSAGIFTSLVGVGVSGVGAPEIFGAIVPNGCVPAGTSTVTATTCSDALAAFSNEMRSAGCLLMGSVSAQDSPPPGVLTYRNAVFDCTSSPQQVTLSWGRAIHATAALAPLPTTPASILQRMR